MLKLLFNWKVWLLISVLGGYVVYKPSVVGNKAVEQQINHLKQNLASGNPQAIKKVLGITDTAKEAAVNLYQKAADSQTIPGLPKEIVVDQYVNQLTDKIKGLPQAELIQVKRTFCQDVINEATSAAK